MEPKQKQQQVPLGGVSPLSPQTETEAGVSAHREEGRRQGHLLPEEAVSHGAPDTAFQRAIANKH